MRRHSRSLIDQFEQRALDSTDVSQVSSFLQMAPKPPEHARFRQSTIFHKGDLSSHIDERLSWWVPQLQRINNQVPAYRLQIEYGRSDPQKTSGVFVIVPGFAEGLHRIVTISYSTFWNKAVTKLIRHLYPGAMPVFFKQEEIQSALETFQENLGHEFAVMIVEMTMKRKVVEDALSPAGYVETDRVWTELTVHDAFDQAREGGYWFTGIKYEVLRRRQRSSGYDKISTGRIYKRGAANYDHLCLEFNQSAIKVLEEASSERLRFLSKRGIRERNYVPSRPLQIEYSRDIFADPSEVKRFAEAIASYPKSTRAVFHANPYYRASVADFEDGSSMDIWILSPRRVLISPQAKSSEQALQRLISHIFFDFQEGTLTEYVE